MTTPSLSDRIASLEPWYQRFDFDGIQVGEWPSDRLMESLFEGIDLQDRSLLDVGCMAGACMLWAERHGAMCVGIDPNERNEQQDRLVQEYFRADFQFGRRGVETLDPRDGADYVLMAGLYYHLQDPLGGLRRCWDCARTALMIEGEVLAGATGCHANFYPGEYRGDPTNWWVPTVECLQAWISTLPGVGDVRLIYPFLGNRSRAGAVVTRAKR
jgi:SAM-dependent methyltransferase